MTHFDNISCSDMDREVDNCTYDVIEKLVTSNPGLSDHRDVNLNTPLLLAAAHKSRRSVRILLDNGASIDAVNNRGNSSLHMATKLKSLPVLLLLLERNAYKELWDEGVSDRQ